MEFLVGIIVVFIMLFDKKPYQIKYDRKDYEISLIGAVIFTALKYFCTFLLYKKGIDGAFLLQMVFQAYVAFGFISYIGWARLVDCIFYFKRLQRLGYQIPDKKKSYDGLLEKLPRAENSKLQEQNVEDEKDSKQSVILAVLSWLIATVCIVFTVSYWNEYKDLEGIATICLCVFGVMIFAWACIGNLFWRQKSIDKYCDDVNEDRKCKPRIQFVQGITIILLGVFLSFMVGMAMNMFSEIVLNVREQSYQEEQGQ